MYWKTDENPHLLTSKHLFEILSYKMSSQWYKEDDIKLSLPQQHFWMCCDTFAPTRLGPKWPQHCLTTQVDNDLLKNEYFFEIKSTKHLVNNAKKTMSQFYSHNINFENDKTHFHLTGWIKDWQKIYWKTDKNPHLLISKHLFEILKHKMSS